MRRKQDPPEGPEGPDNLGSLENLLDRIAREGDEAPWDEFFAAVQDLVASAQREQAAVLAQTLQPLGWWSGFILAWLAERAELLALFEPRSRGVDPNG